MEVLVPSILGMFQAIDPDSDRNNNNRITYTIVGGDITGPWQIHPETGVITATRPVDYETTPRGRGV